MKGWMGRNTSAGRRLAAYATDRSFGGTRHRAKTSMAIQSLIHQIEGKKKKRFFGGGLYYEIALTINIAREKNIKCGLRPPPLVLGCLPDAPAMVCKPEKN